MSDLNNRLLRYIDRLEEPVSLEETMTRPEHRRFRVTAAVLAGAAIVLVPALVLIGLRFLPAGDDVSGSTLLPETTTTVIPEGNVTTTTSFQVTTDAPGSVVVPDLAGLTADEARAQLADLHLACEITEQYPSRNGFGSITAQSPVAGESVAAGGTIEVGVQVKAGCLDYTTGDYARRGSTTVQVLLECGRDGSTPTSPARSHGSNQSQTRSRQRCGQCWRDPRMKSAPWVSPRRSPNWTPMPSIRYRSTIDD